ncbi:hypothetical protein B0H94_101125 [Salsuginibacillus halophilus]|uniref:Flagellar Assembly Protein A N-terminal region domain-containing protein n=1 Tax=Salsuginibacillus halophilus TaxID=517424 RepID=A0A2P8HYF7_9BACI|nr:FapA family protein [Salsuginibacillus halophilus]PSL51215.1 hypothetical protein B0H94_101125 [Salsuginibacillus halophilus]
MELSNFLRVKVSADRLAAELQQMKPFDEETLPNMEDLTKFVQEENGLAFGVQEGVLRDIAEAPEEAKFPVQLAAGQAPGEGRDAYLEIASLQQQDDNAPEDTSRVDLKKVLEIPMVKQGEKVGWKVPATKGEDGTDVYGEPVEGKFGRDFKLRAGKNTRLTDDELELYAVVDGQVSADTKQIHVYPVYEVQGDLDLKTGNIDFVGNVTIHGSVPAGFEVKAKGDIRVKGTVDAAYLEAQGAVVVGEGIVGQGEGKVTAGSTVHTTYINQGNVEAEADIYVKQAVLHSRVETAGSIYCTENKGMIVGGNVSAVGRIEANDIGNEMNTPTELYLGQSQKFVNKQEEMEQTLEHAKAELENVRKLNEAFKQKEDSGVELTSKERIMKLRVRSTETLMQEKKELAEEGLNELKASQTDAEAGEVRVYRRIYPNTTLNFGKYRKKVHKPHEYMRFRLEQSEIKTEPL